MKKILYLILFMMLILLLAEFENELMHILYSKSDSASYLTELTQPGKYASIFLIVLNGIIIWKYDSIKVILTLFVISVLTIFLLNRVIAIRIYPTCEISSGWFLFRTQMIDLNKEGNCENIITRTSCEKLPFWRIRIKNKEMDAVIFAGPFQEKRLLRILKDKNFEIKTP